MTPDDSGANECYDNVYILIIIMYTVTYLGSTYLSFTQSKRLCMIYNIIEPDQSEPFRFMIIWFFWFVGILCIILFVYNFYRSLQIDY